MNAKIHVYNHASIIVYMDTGIHVYMYFRILVYMYTCMQSRAKFLLVKYFTISGWLQVVTKFYDIITLCDFFHKCIIGKLNVSNSN